VYSEPTFKSSNFILFPISINSIPLRNQTTLDSGFESTIQLMVNTCVLFIIKISFGVSINLGES
jgi:hypothetical protein